MPFRPNPTKKPLIPLAQVSSPPRADLTPQQQPIVEEPVGLASYTSQTGRSEQGQSSGQHRDKACVALTMLLRQGCKRRGKPARSYKRI
jgi:hypothetical protein